MDLDVVVVAPIQAKTPAEPITRERVNEQAAKMKRAAVEGSRRRRTGRKHAKGQSQLATAQATQAAAAASEAIAAAEAGV